MRWGSIWPGFGSPRRICRDIGGNNSPGREHTQAPLYHPLISNLRAQALCQSSPRELKMHKRQCEMELGPSSFFFCSPKVWGLQKYETILLPPSLPAPPQHPSHLSISPVHPLNRQGTQSQEESGPGMENDLMLCGFHLIYRFSSRMRRKPCKQATLIERRSRLMRVVFLWKPAVSGQLAIAKVCK